MARYTYTVLVNALPGREEEFLEWYSTNHLNDVLKMPGVVSGKLFQLDFHRIYDLDAPKWTCMTIYELDCEDPEATINAIRDASGTPAMPACDAVARAGMVQVAGHLIAEAG